jgi:KUP system potassium uptake protein
VATARTRQGISDEADRFAGEGGLPEDDRSRGRFLVLGLTALGVVFGDIGTSPIYALRVAFMSHHAMTPTPDNVLGVLSLIFWSLVVIISAKYMLYVMRADNEGEGGILALMALVHPMHEGPHPERKVVAVLGVFGAALLYGDGMITPAISVLSAVEGLEVAIPAFDRHVVPATVIILVLLFAFQRRGTARVGFVFGPVMVVWFATLAVLGLRGILLRPAVLSALIPTHAIGFLARNGLQGFLVLGAIFLVVTGGEALYADLGHFTRRTIRLTWFALVQPALLLNYFGQGALLLARPEEVTQPFYRLAPAWALYPMVVLATVATVIASQAIISAVFSLTRQATLLGLFPRVRIVQTSPERIGQIYIPGINWLLMLATIALVMAFKRSNNLAAAYGIAVSITMVITTMLAYVVARELWGWSKPVAILTTGLFVAVDTAFLGANLYRIVEGGWVPLLVGTVAFVVLWTWKTGRTVIRGKLATNTESLEGLLREMAQNPPARVAGTAVFMAGSPVGAPPMLVRLLRHSRALHEHVIVLTVVVANVPRVPRSGRLEIEHLGQGICRIVLHFGFMQNPLVPRALRQNAKRIGPDVDFDGASYYVGGQVLLVADHHHGMARWRKRLFAFMARNATRPMAFYGLPLERVVEIGTPIEF